MKMSYYLSERETKLNMLISLICKQIVSKLGFECLDKAVIPGGSLGMGVEGVGGSRILASYKGILDGGCGRSFPLS